MRITPLITCARHKKVVVKTHDTTWTGIVTDNDKTFVLLKNASSIDPLTGQTPADGYIILNTQTIEFIQILTETLNDE